MWWEVVSILACLQLLAGVCHAVTVTQKEQYKIIEVGIKTSIDCSHDDSTYLTILWYRQDSNSADRTLQLIGYSVHGNNPEMTMTTYTIERPNVTHATLSIPAKQAAESAVYFCAASWDRDNSPLSFGQGTRISVLEKGQSISSPNVTIFAPSEEEVKEKQKATIVCLATNFFPDHVNLSWYLNDELRTDGVKTEAPEYDKTKKEYSLISRIRITSKEWQNSNNKFKCNVEFYNEIGKSDYSDEISGRECDGGSAEVKETYLRRANLGKLVYILLIFKSTLYGAFVMGLKLRKKVVP